MSLRLPRFKSLMRLGALAALAACGSAASAYNCGPNVLTYAILKADGSTAGVRCVKLTFLGVNEYGLPEYTLTWYGEGNWGNGAHRHVGTAIQTTNLGTVGMAADISGNGEIFANRSNPTPDIREASVTPSQIAMRGAWNEVWHLRSNVAYTPLRQPTVCGAQLKGYEVRAAGGAGAATGLRCVADFGSWGSLWYGVGNWGSGPYAHLGTVWGPYGLGPAPGTPRAGQADDLCDSSRGQTCSSFGAHSIQFMPTADNKGFNLSGAWSEHWHLPVPTTPPCRYNPRLPDSC